MSKKLRITANLPRLDSSVYARTEVPQSAPEIEHTDADVSPPAHARVRVGSMTKRQIYVLDVDQVAWIKRLALQLFVASDGCDPGQSAIVRGILRGVMESGIDLATHVSTADDVRQFIRGKLTTVE